jgi:glycosyltransferase involved in cell wall biosynthesis
MRIAQIMLAKRFGGAERSFVDLCRALARRGHEVLVICERRAEALRQIEQIAGVTSRTVTARGAWDFLARRAIKQHLQEFNADIAQMHLARAAHLAGPAARRLGIPTLAKTHNYVNLKYYRAIDHLVATTAKQYEFLCAAGVPVTRVSRIPNFSAIGAPLADEKREGRGAALKVVAIGRLVRKKGFDVLLRALAATRRKGVVFDLTIVGAGPESDALVRLCSDLELNDAVTFLGWQDEVAGSLSPADVFVLPSRDEPFGIVCLEAMALAVPIIATLTDGPREILDADCAILVERDDSDALAEALEAVAADPDEAARRAAVARKRFENCYSEEVVVSQYLALYAQLYGLRGSSKQS